MSHDFEGGAGRPLTERDLWMKYVGKPKPARRQHEYSMDCDFCQRERARAAGRDLLPPVRQPGEPDLLAVLGGGQVMSFEEIVCKDREEWLKVRRLGIGASEAAAVLGASPWKTSMDLWGEKVGLVTEPVEETEAMKWGLRLEDAIAEAYMDETGRMVINPGQWTVARSKDHPFMLATLDREIVPVDDRGPGLLELKTTALWRKDEWEQEPPLQYIIQWQHQAKVRGVTWGSIAVLCGGQRFVWVDVVRQDEFIALLVEKEKAFWDLVTAETMPTIDGSESAKEMLKRLYPKHEEGKVIELPNEAVTWHQDLRAVKDELKRLGARELELKNLFANAFKDAEVGVLPSGDSYTYKAIHKDSYVVKEQNYRELRFRAKKDRR